MCNDCTFDKHISNISLIARQIAGWILRTFNSRSKELMLTMWKSLVIPRLDYCSQLWCPYKTGHIQQLEVIQQSFIRKINNVNSKNYWERLAELKLYSLERRRERYRIIYVWKILEKLVPNISDQENCGIKKLWSDRLGRSCALPSINSKTPASLQSTLRGSLSFHGVQLFNILPRYIRNMTECGIDEFKRALDQFLSLIPDEPQVPGYTACRTADSNSLLHMIKSMTQELSAAPLGRRGNPLSRR